MSGAIVEKVKIATQPLATIPTAALESLAARFRPGGLFLMTLHSDGSVAYFDSEASVFFHRYALPILQWRESVDREFKEHLDAVNPASDVAIWQFVPGIFAAAFPYVDRKSMTGIVLLVGKAPAFRLTEDVVRLCNRLGLDAIWLGQQADQLIAYSDGEVQRQGKLLRDMVQDQVRLAGQEQELDSFSAQLSNTYEELNLIYQLSGGMWVNRSPGDFFKQACLEVMDVLHVRGIGVALPADGTLIPQPLLYGSLSLPPGQVHRLAEELMSALRQRDNPLLINQIHKDKNFKWLSGYAHQLLAVPLQRRDQVLGCLFALDKTSDEFDTIDSKLLNAIANQSAIYLENSLLYGDLRDLMMGLMHSLVSAVDAKDAYTCGHSERVAMLGRVLAEEAGLDAQQVEQVYMAGLLHDVGKIGVPEAVLKKTGRLTPEEFEQIKKHPEIGARILHDIKQVHDIIPGVMHHHERYDGKGYPSGLAGEKIPLMGRLICLVDCFDAMTSSRTYRRAMPLEVALTEIRRCSGTQFDPGLTDTFLSIGAERLRELLVDHKRQSRQMNELAQNLRAA